VWGWCFLGLVVVGVGVWGGGFGGGGGGGFGVVGVLVGVVWWFGYVTQVDVVDTTCLGGENPDGGDKKKEKARGRWVLQFPGGIARDANLRGGSFPRQRNRPVLHLS